MSDDPRVNNTIITMVNDLKATGGGAKTEDYKTPLKRSLSSNSLESSSEDSSPTKRFRKQSSLDLSYVGSPREIRRLRADLIEARNTILDLKGRIQHMHNIRKETHLMFDNETKSLKKQTEWNQKTIEELELQLQSIRKRESTVKLELSGMKDKYEKLKLSTEEKILTLESEMEALKDESQTAFLVDNIESSKLKRKITELETILQAAQDDAEAQKKLASELGKQLNEKNCVHRELDLKEVAFQKLKNQLRALESAKEDYLEYKQQAKSQAHKLVRYTELEKENERLKEDFARLKTNLKNNLLLEEEVYDLRNRLGKHKELEKRVADLQAKYDHNEMYLGEWKAVARVFCESTENDATLPHLLRSTIERLQQQELSLTAEKIDFETQLKSAQHVAKVTKSELEKNQKLLSELSSTGEEKRTLIHRLQKKLLLVSRERDSYRLQLDSYERDLTMVVNTTGGGQASNMLQSQKERIDSLEKTVDGYRDMVAKLENDLQEAQPQLYSEVVPVRQEQISRLQNKVAKLREECEQLRQHRDTLEIRLESLNDGHDTLQGGQVLHLANNPLSECLNQRQQKLEQLQEENLRLKNKLKKIAEGIETSNLGDVSVCPKEVSALKEQIEINEKQTQKLKDYFKSSMQDFRNVVYMLFGYKIDRPSNSSIYKLRSMYAEQADDNLCFEVNQEGNLNLLENDFTSGLGSVIELHLIQQKSIPMFLSAITVDLFNQKTMTGTY